MRVLHIAPTYFPSIGGIETVVRELAAHLCENGVVADVMHLSPQHRRWSEERIDGSTVWRVPLFPNRLVGVAPSIRPLLMNYDLLHVHDPQGMALSANVLVQGRGKRKVLSTHGGYFHSSKYSFIKQMHWQFVSSTLLKEYDAVLASSTADREAFSKKAPNVELVENGVSVAKFLGVRRSSASCADRWIYWGRLSRNKRIEVLIDTVRRLHDAGMPVRLTVAGDDFDGLLPSLHSQVAALGLGQHIRLLGRLTDEALLNECAAHGVFITASEYEGFGLSIFEAMAAGLVVICRDIAPLNQHVQSGTNGLLLAFDRGSDDLNSLRRLCAIPAGDFAALQAHARLTAIPRDWDKTVQRFMDVYERVAGSKPGMKRSGEEA